MLRLASLSTALLVIGCADQGDEGMTVVNNTAVSGATCSLSGDASQPFMSHGTINAFSPNGYTLTPLIQSRVTASTSPGGGSAVMTTPDTLQRTIQLRGADVRLTLKAISVEQNGAYNVTQPEANVGEFGVLFSGSLPPGGTVNVGFEVITPAQLRSIIGMAGVDPATASINAEVLAEVTIRGDLGGSEIESSPFYYPISVCNDCVVNVVGTCPLPATAAPRSGNACNPFQDGTVDCCETADGVICPALVESM